MVTAIQDPASEHLALAWGHAYGRNPDPGDAWDHSIKAVEAVLIPIVAVAIVQSARDGKIVKR